MDQWLRKIPYLTTEPLPEELTAQWKVHTVDMQAKGHDSSQSWRVLCYEEDSVHTLAGLEVLCGWTLPLWGEDLELRLQ